MASFMGREYLNKGHLWTILYSKTITFYESCRALIAGLPRFFASQSPVLQDKNPTPGTDIQEDSSADSEALRESTKIAKDFDDIKDNYDHGELMIPATVKNKAGASCRLLSKSRYLNVVESSLDILKCKLRQIGLVIRRLNIRHLGIAWPTPTSSFFITPHFPLACHLNAWSCKLKSSNFIA